MWAKGPAVASLKFGIEVACSPSLRMLDHFLGQLLWLTLAPSPARNAIHLKAKMKFNSKAGTPEASSLAHCPLPSRQGTNQSRNPLYLKAFSLWLHEPFFGSLDPIAPECSALVPGKPRFIPKWSAAHTALVPFWNNKHITYQEKKTSPF